MLVLVFFCGFWHLPGKLINLPAKPIPLHAVPKGAVCLLNNSFFGNCVNVLQLCKMELTEVF